MSNFKALETHFQKVHPDWTQGEINAAAIQKAATIDAFCAGYAACKGKMPSIEELKKALMDAGLLKYAQIYSPRLYGISELWEAQTQSQATKVIPIAQQQKRKIKKIKKIKKPQQRCFRIKTLRTC